MSFRLTASFEKGKPSIRVSSRSRNPQVTAQATTIRPVMIVNTGPNPTASYIAPAESDPTMDAANEAAFALPIFSARVPTAAICPTSDSVISDAPVTTTPCNARMRMNDPDESTSGKSP